MQRSSQCAFASAFGCEKDHLMAVCEWLVQRRVMTAKGLENASCISWKVVFAPQANPSLSLCNRGKLNIGGEPKVEGVLVEFLLGEEARSLFWSAVESKVYTSQDARSATAVRGAIPVREFVSTHLSEAGRYREAQAHYAAVAGMAAHDVQAMRLDTRAKAYPILLAMARRFPLDRIKMDHEAVLKELLNDYKRAKLGA